MTGKSQQLAENFSNNLNDFHALEIATLAFNLILTSQLLHAPRAQQPIADLPRNKSTSSTNSSTSRRVVHHLASRGQRLITRATSPEFKVCNGDVLACSDND